MIRNINIDLVYQNFIDAPPQAKEQLWNHAASGDDVTMAHWQDIWFENIKANKERYGDFASKAIGKLYGINRHKPMIVCGSGPSLKHSIESLRENAQAEHPVKSISCLHNFGYFEDEGFHADYYVTLDAGDIVVNDVFEGRKNLPGYYWEKTKGKVLLASTTAPKKLLDLWQGEVYLFSIMMPSVELHKKFQEVERLAHYVSCGGNALGGCMYIAKCIMGSDPIIYVGADFCFDYDNTFHSYKTHYDTIGGYVLWPDCFGNMRKTWQSYLNFKFWFDFVACQMPGRYISCSEGLLGAYREGNIRQFQYMSLDAALTPYKMTERVFLERIEQNKVISKDRINLKELFENPAYEREIVMI